MGIDLICENAYNNARNQYSEYKYECCKSDFQDCIIKEFFRRIPHREYDDEYSSQRIDNWKLKLKFEAGEWFDEYSRKVAEEYERQEREEEELLRKLSDELKINDDRIRAKVETAIKNSTVDSLKNLLNDLNHELKSINKKINGLSSDNQNECEIWIQNIKKYKEQVKNQILVAEENERIAKRKEQEEANRQQLELIQAKWRESQNLQQASKSLHKTANISCPKCGEEVSPSAKFCSSCGTKLSVVCEVCGTSLKSTAKFCTNCGTPVDKNAKPNKTIEETQPEKESVEFIDEVTDKTIVNADLLFHLALMDLNDNPEKAIKDIEIAAEMDNIPALHFLGSCYLEGEYVDEDNKKAEKYLKRASEMGDAASQCDYAKLLSKVGKKEEFKKWLRKSAEGGNSGAQYLLATKILEGYDEAPEKDSPEFKELMKWLTLSAEQNYGLSQYMLGLLYSDEDFPLYSITKAKDWFKKAIENGIEDAEESLKELNDQFLD